MKRAAKKARGEPGSRPRRKLTGRNYFYCDGFSQVETSTLLHFQKGLRRLVRRNERLFWNSVGVLAHVDDELLRRGVTK